jgi:hypothetical protein
VASGSYREVLTSLRQVPTKPKAAIVVFAKGIGMEAFLESWSEIFPDAPVAGGAAARPSGQGRGEILPAAADVAVLLITDGTWRAETMNVHEATGTNVEFRGEGPRSISEVRQLPEGEWESAAAFFRAQHAEAGRDAADCESITVSDMGGRNLHLSYAGESLVSGADLPSDNRLMLRTVSRELAAKRLDRFCSEPGALVFGCAGLRSLLDSRLATGRGTLAGFMFGELVTLDGRPQFGNLMAARLKRER